MNTTFEFIYSTYHYYAFECLNEINTALAALTRRKKNPVRVVDVGQPQEIWNAPHDMVMLAVKVECELLPEPPADPEPRKPGESEEAALVRQTLENIAFVTKHIRRYKPEWIRLAHKYLSQMGYNTQAQALYDASATAKMNVFEIWPVPPVAG